MTGATVSYPQPRLRLGRWALGATAVLFGVATLVEGGHVLFGGPAARQEAGNVVSFVLLFNFGAGFAYVLAGLAALLGGSWATGSPERSRSRRWWSSSRSACMCSRVVPSSCAQSSR